MRTMISVALAAGILALASCSSADDTADAAGTTADSTSHGSEHGDAMGAGCTGNMECTGSEMTYADGVEMVGMHGKLKIQIVSSTPASPALGDNMVMLKVMDAAGNELEDATFGDGTNTWQYCMLKRRL